MTKEQLVRHLSNMATAAGVLTNDVENLAKTAAEVGFMEFWNVRPWSFRVKEYSLSITSTADEYNLPADFRAVRSVREKSTQSGYQLRFLGKEEFDYAFPRQDAVPAAYPKVYTVYLTGNVHKIKFAPRPTAMTVYIDYLSGTPGDVVIVPDEAVGALVATCEKYIYPAKSSARIEAAKIAQVEIADLENREGQFGGTLFKIFDDTDYQTDTTRPWV